MKTVSIRVPKAFTLTHADHTTQTFAEGLHEVTPEVAAHWYVQAHSVAVANQPAEPEAEAPGIAEVKTKSKR